MLSAAAAGKVTAVSPDGDGTFGAIARSCA
jgi:hypothetical protein